MENINKHRPNGRMHMYDKSEATYTCAEVKFIMVIVSWLCVCVWVLCLSRELTHEFRPAIAKASESI